ncbi:MAG: hypothetical protein GC171_16545 [Terrimonas sp.]|nr:hypothetical protein [Terrimonas sp.]
MARQPMRLFLPGTILFIGLNSFFLFFPENLQAINIDKDVVIIGNAFIFLVTLISFMMSAKGLLSKNNHAFFRLIYGSFILKLFLLAAVAFAYIMVMKKDVNKPGLFMCMGLYLVYTFIEVRGLMILSKNNKNA